MAHPSVSTFSIFSPPGEAGHAQMVREACGELRKAAAEVLEMIHESVTAEAAEVAQYWQVRMVTAAAASKATLKKEDIHDI